MRSLVLIVCVTLVLLSEECYGRPRKRDNTNKATNNQIQVEPGSDKVGSQNVVNEIVSHPPVIMMDNNGDYREFTHTLPFEMSNPTHVDADELYQSDMLFSEAQWTAMRSRKGLNITDMRWPEGEDGFPLVPYTFLDSVNKEVIRKGLNHWIEGTCIKFEETNNTDQPHLQFHNGHGCWSYVGMNYWEDGQLISIGSTCNKYTTVAHEVGHALGFFHEQARSDRDDRIIVVYDNIDERRFANFHTAPDNNYGVPYDYSSLMHYGPYYFSKNGMPTLISKDPLEQELIGTRTGLTHRDKLLANRMYDCTGKWLAACNLTSDPCLNGGYIGKDCKCICSPGTNGTNCKDVISDYYAHARDPNSEIITTEKNFKVITPMYSGSAFTKWIIPPTCNIAKLTVVSARLWSGSCGYQHLTVKTNSSDLMGQILCAKDVTPGLTFSSDTGIIINMINFVNYRFEMLLLEAGVKFQRIPGCLPTFYQK